MPQLSEDKEGAGGEGEKKGGFFKWLASGAAVLALALLGYGIHEVFFNDTLTIDAIGMPKDFSEAGLSPDVMAEHLGERLRQMETAVKTSVKKDVLETKTSADALPEIEIPGTKLSFKTVVDMARSLLDRDPKHIGGDLVLDPHCDPQAPAGSTDTTARVTVSFRQGRSHRSSLVACVPKDNQEAIVQRAAELALQQVNPYMLAAYRFDRGDAQGAYALSQLAVGDITREPRYRAASAVLSGNILLLEGRYEDAAALYQQAAIVDPRYAVAHASLVITLGAERRFDEAAGEFQQAIKLDPNSALAYNAWGMTLTLQGRPDEAISMYQKAVLLNPGSAFSYHNEIGNILNFEGKYKEAIEEYTQSISLSPNAAGAYNGWGAALTGLNKNDEAIEKFQTAINIDPANAFAYCNWGIALNKEGKYEEAIQKFQQAIKLDPHFALAHASLGDALNAMSRNDEARKAYATAQKLRPDAPSHL
jgi:tetratricopeptide (TPR) repeat protein